jgi:hypothetical protein
VEAEEKQPLEEVKGAVCQVEEDLDLQHMLRIMGETEGKTIPIELEDDMLLGEIDST